MSQREATSISKVIWPLSLDHPRGAEGSGVGSSQGETETGGGGVAVGTCRPQGSENRGAGGAERQAERTPGRKPCLLHLCERTEEQPRVRALGDPKPQNSR